MLDQRFVREDFLHGLKYGRRNGGLILETAGSSKPVAVDWVFGSGRHAQTPISLYRNASGEVELLQHHLSWYPAHGLDWTLGSLEIPAYASGVDVLGKRIDPAATRECFECHCSVVPQPDGKLQIAGLVPGVSCERCHSESAAHAAAQSRGQTLPTGEVWSRLTPLKAINRCGECHRRSDHFTAEELYPSNIRLVRFAPVGLSQSRCFTQQAHVRDAEGRAVRLDCVTCHDPHQPEAKTVESYSDACRQCHGTHSHAAPVCSSRDVNLRCVECHMPKREQQQYLHFTDHWLRAATSADTAK